MSLNINKTEAENVKTKNKVLGNIPPAEGNAVINGEKINPDYGKAGDLSMFAPSATYSNPLRKIGGGGVLQYPIDLDTDLQDYFEIQIFRYRAAGTLPDLTASNQGYNTDTQGNLIDKDQFGNPFGGYFAGSNRRGNRQNFRLQDLQSTIQLPIPPSIKDMNSVDFAGGTMSGLAGAAFSPIVQAFLRRDKAFDEAIKGGDFRLRTQAFGVLKRLKSATGGVLGAVGEAIENPE